ncbi:unnamed protein product [Ascophyllum nodosum]
MPGSFPAPPAFLDDSFTAVSLANSKIGDSFVRDTLSRRCPMLRSVDLTACFYIRDASLEALLKRCPLIERLSLRNCRKLTDQSLEYVVRNGKKIVALDIGGCFNLTAAGVDSLCTIHPNTSTFAELDISGIAVTTHTLELICKHCRNIRVLRMGFIEYMEATLTHTLDPLAPKLRSLHVHWNTCVTDDFLMWAAKTMPLLHDINLCGCSHITVDGVSGMLYERQEALSRGPAGTVSPIEKVKMRYTSIQKQDVEALQSAFNDVDFR